MKRDLKPVVLSCLLVLSWCPHSWAAKDDVVSLDDADLELDEEESKVVSQETAKESLEKASTSDDLGEFEEFKDATAESSETESGIEKEFQSVDGDVPPPQIDEPPAPVAAEAAPDAAPEPEAAPPPPAVEATAPTPEPTTIADQPNQELEKRLYDIYVKYQQKQIPESEWMSIVGTKQNEEYQIQAGNTLWDISQTFFGDGNFWPKVWSMNGDIKNPHLIVPGNRIVFTPGDISQAPKVALNENAPASGTTTDASPNQISQENPADQIEIPPPSKIYPPVLKKLPPSFPNLVSDRVKRQYDEIGFDGSLKDPVRVVNRTPIVEQMVDENPAILGEVIEVAGGESKRASTYQYIFVKTDSQLQTGDKLVSFHIKEGSSPKVLQIEADLTITDVLDENRHVYKALVTQTIDPVRVESKVMIGRVEFADFSTQGRSNSTRANIIGGQFDNDRHIASIGDLVFLDEGSSQGLQAGDVLSVIVNNKVRNPDSFVNSLGQAAGLVKIVHASSRHSTALVVGVLGPIYTGDFTAGPELFQNGGHFKAREIIDLDQEALSPEARGVTDQTPVESDSELTSSAGLEEDLSMESELNESGSSEGSSESGSDFDLDSEL